MNTGQWMIENKINNWLLKQSTTLPINYDTADYVIFRCDTENCDNTRFNVTLGQLADADGWIECEYCGKACSRLLADGTWQSQAERDQLNQIEYQRRLGE